MVLIIRITQDQEVYAFYLVGEIHQGLEGEELWLRYVVSPSLSLLSEKFTATA